MHKPLLVKVSDLKKEKIPAWTKYASNVSFYNEQNLGMSELIVF